MLIDLRCLLTDEPEPAGFRSQRVATLPRSDLEARPYAVADNLVLDDEQTAISELAAFRAAGGRSVIDMTVEGIGPNPVALQRISAQAGVHILAGAGIYRAFAHPPWVRDASPEQLAVRFIHAVREGIDGTTVRAGLLGELGTSSPIHPDEEKALRAAATAHRETEVPINVHCDLFSTEGLKVLDVLESEGVDPQHVALSHMDELLNLEYHAAIAARGAWLSFDTLGSELQLGDHHEPRDAERITHLCRLVDRGYARQILLSQDVCTKMQLRRYGGGGYANLLTRIVPQLQSSGLDRGLIQQFLVENPRRYLAGD